MKPMRLIIFLVMGLAASGVEAFSEEKEFPVNSDYKIGRTELWLTFREMRKDTGYRWAVFKDANGQRYIMEMMREGNGSVIHVEKTSVDVLKKEAPLVPKDTTLTEFYDWLGKVDLGFGIARKWGYTNGLNGYYQALDSAPSLETLTKAFLHQAAIDAEMEKREKESSLMHQLIAGCNAGNAEPCYRAGYNYLNGSDGFPPDESEATRFYKKACDHGHAGGCFSMGLVNSQPENRAMAASYFDRACKLGNLDSCINLGDMYTRGDGVPANKEWATTYFKLACQGGNENGCSKWDTARGVVRRNDYQPPEDDSLCGSDADVLYGIIGNCNR